MAIQGVEGLSVGEVHKLVDQGAKFIVFTYAISVLVMTFRRPTDVYFIRPDESAAVKSLPWTFLSLLLGWWGFPWGLVYTPMAIFGNLSGGQDVTMQVLANLADTPQPLRQSAAR